MAKKKSEFHKPIRKDIDSPESLAFIESAEQKPKTGAAGRKKTKAPKTAPDLRSLVDDLKARTEGLRSDDKATAAELMAQYLLMVEIEDIGLRSGLEAARRLGRLLSARTGSESLNQGEPLPELSETEQRGMMVLGALDDSFFEAALSRLESAMTRALETMIRRAGRLAAEAEAELEAPAGYGDTSVSTENPPSSERMDDEFKTAAMNMIEALKAADENGWSSTTRLAALNQIDMFRHLVVIGDDG